jgi:hypothetical protein
MRNDYMRIMNYKVLTYNNLRIINFFNSSDIEYEVKISLFLG